MNTYFIHTMELSFRTNFDGIKVLTNNLNFVKVNDDYKCFEYTENGITIINRKCSSNERKDGKGGYKLILIVNPSRTLKMGTNKNQIHCMKDFHMAVVKLNEMIRSIFTDLTLDSFKLSRIDITEDIKYIPENIIREHILIMRRMPMYSGFKLNTALEKNTENFRSEDSFNTINESKGIEFVVYNKSRAVFDQGYSTDDTEFYKDTLRMELRCNRKFIRKNTKDLSITNALFTIYNKRKKLVADSFSSLFNFSTEVCFIPYYWQKKVIDKRFHNKPAKKAKMKILSNFMNGSAKPDLNNALDTLFNSDKAKCNVMHGFEDIGLSPIPIGNNDIPFMQSIDSLLEFKEANENDKRNYKYILKHTRGKEVFFHETK